MSEWQFFVCCRHGWRAYGKPCPACAAEGCPLCASQLTPNHAGFAQGGVTPAGDETGTGSVDEVDSTRSDAVGCAQTPEIPEAS